MNTHEIAPRKFPSEAQVAYAYHLFLSMSLVLSKGKSKGLIQIGTSDICNSLRSLSELVQHEIKSSVGIELTTS